MIFIYEYPFYVNSSNQLKENFEKCVEDAARDLIANDEFWEGGKNWKAEINSLYEPTDSGDINIIIVKNEYKSLKYQVWILGWREA